MAFATMRSRSTGFLLVPSILLVALMLAALLAPAVRADPVVVAPTLGVRPGEGETAPVNSEVVIEVQGAGNTNIPIEVTLTTSAGSVDVPLEQRCGVGANAS